MANHNAQIYRSNLQSQELMNRCYTQAHRAESSEKNAHRHENKIEQLDQVHEDYSSLHSGIAAFYWQALFALAVIYFMDCYLLGAGAEYIATLSGSALASSARWVVPALILWLEILVAGLIHNARISFDDPEGSNYALFGYAILGIILSVVVPLFSIAAMEIGNNKYILLVFALAILSLASHAAILFSGRIMHDAKGYPSYKIKRGVHGIQLKRYLFILKRADLALIRAYSTLQTRIDFHNGIYPEKPIRNLTFDEITRRRIKNLFEDNVDEGKTKKSNINNSQEHPSKSKTVGDENNQPQRTQGKTDDDMDDFIHDTTDDDLTA